MRLYNLSNFITRSEMGPKLYKLEVVTCTLIGNDDVVSILAGKNK